MNIIFIAPPAAGKGTQSQLLKDKYDLDHISTGDLLREVASEKTPLGEKIANIINNGELVSDDIMLEMLKNKINSLKNSKGIIFDGFPRNTKQAVMLDELLNSLNKQIDHVLYLNIEKSVAMKRAIGRITCKECNSIYNVCFDEFKEKNKCNKCDSTLEKRQDDTEEMFNNRFDTFLEKTKPLIDFYKNKSLLKIVDCADEKEGTFSRIESVIND